MCLAHKVQKASLVPPEHDRHYLSSWAKFCTGGSPRTSRRSMGRCTVGHPPPKVLSYTVRPREAREQQQNWRVCATSRPRDRASKSSLSAPEPQLPSGPCWCRCLLCMLEMIHHCQGCLVYTASPSLACPFRITERRKEKKPKPRVFLSTELLIPKMTFLAW